jgi:eukaryotic-like serine/threonine-protein kinase
VKSTGENPNAVNDKKSLVSRAAAAPALSWPSIRGLTPPEPPGSKLFSAFSIWGPVALLACAVTIASLHAADLPPPTKTSWKSFRHDLAQTGVASSTLPEKLELLWEVSLGDQVVATSAVVGEFVYVPCLSGELVCLDRKTGAKIWGYKSVEKVEKNSFAPGFKSSPTVTADAVYLGDEDGVFHAIDRKTGQNRWKFATGGEIYSSAAVLDGRVLFGSYDNRLYCLNEKDGSLAWRYETLGYVHCAPAVVEGVTFIAGCDEHLRVIDVKTGEQRFEMPLETYLIASPAIVGDMLYVGTYASEVVAVNWKTQDVAWRYLSGESEFPFHSSAAVTEKSVVVGGRDKLVHAIDRATGKRAWTFATRAKIDSSPVVVGDRVFIGSNDGNLYELSLTDGTERWKFNAGKPISAGPAVGEGVLVIGSESRDGKVYCFGKK